MWNNTRDIHGQASTAVFPFSAVKLFVGQQEGNLAYIKVGVGLWVAIVCSFTRLIISAVTSIIPSSNKSSMETF